MGRSVLVGFAVLISAVIFLLAGTTGCGHGGAVTTVPNAVPASISLTPALNVSMDLGTNQSFTAQAYNSAHNTVTTQISFQSSNTAVVTVSAGGLVCAGRWDSLSSPQVCTPGPVGVAQVTATAQGVSSPPTTVYVHQHIDKVVLTDVCGTVQPPFPCTLPRYSCQSLSQNSVPQNDVYQANAYSRGVDITSTVGPFSWQAFNSPVATLSNTATGLTNMVNGISMTQVEATAKTPGVTPVFATIGNVTSVPVNFTTCPVQSISLAVTNATRTSETITATVTDTVGNVIMSQGSPSSVPLTWSSSEPSSVNVSSSGQATASVGGAAITASCTPPTCNIGILPSLPIYPEGVVTMVLASNGTPQTANTYVSSSDCATSDGCVSTIVGVSVPGNVVGSPIDLPATPNSLVFNRQGSKAYLGTDSGVLGSKGLMVFDVAAGTISQFTSIPGKVLAVSPDGSEVVVSDTTDTPNQVYIFNTATSTSLPFSIAGATAADFSPDSLKAYIVAGSTLYIYSKVDALQAVTLTAPAVDVAFLANGIFGYLAEAAGIASFPTCWDPSLSSPLGSVPGASGAALIRALPDGATMLALAPPNIETFVAQVSGTPTQTQTLGCPEPRGFLTVSYPSQRSVNLGQGTFVAKQLLISQDGSTAYVITPSLASILAYNIGGETITSFPLVGNANPVQATLTPDGILLYVGASDGSLHVVNTLAGGDFQQIPFPQNLCKNTAGQPWGSLCKPDLIAVLP